MTDQTGSATPPRRSRLCRWRSAPTRLSCWQPVNRCCWSGWRTAGRRSRPDPLRLTWHGRTSPPFHRSSQEGCRCRQKVRCRKLRRGWRRCCCPPGACLRWRCAARPRSRWSRQPVAPWRLERGCWSSRRILRSGSCGPRSHQPPSRMGWRRSRSAASWC